eukprot:15453863-Alexandrium_andersonii.AAC.1
MRGRLPPFRWPSGSAARRRRARAGRCRFAGGGPWVLRDTLHAALQFLIDGNVTNGLSWSCILVPLFWLSSAVAGDALVSGARGGWGGCGRGDARCVPLGIPRATEPSRPL